MIAAEILADSINDAGDRLVTWLLTYPRSIHSELMTYRVLSRNLASSRAISLRKYRQRVVDEPFVPIEWGLDRRGMQATETIADAGDAEAWWARSMFAAIVAHEGGERLGLHKQIVNRVLEPYSHAVGIVTATDHANLFHQRRHRDAEPHFRRLAELMWNLYHEHMPVYRVPGEWHVPYLRDEDVDRSADESPNDSWDPIAGSRHRRDLLKISVGRCARVSYLTHDGRRDPVEDVALHDKLAATTTSDDPGHYSPFEHQAASTPGERHANFSGWRQYRSFFPREAGPSTVDRCLTCGCWGGRHVRTCPTNDPLYNFPEDR